jgi:hypothetical protein
MFEASIVNGPSGTIPPSKTKNMAFNPLTISRSTTCEATSGGSSRQTTRASQGRLLLVFLVHNKGVVVEVAPNNVQYQPSLT